MSDQPSTSRQVLLVEHVDPAASEIERVLSGRGYRVGVAHNGPVALVLAKKLSPDLAIVEVDLPVLDGWELARRLRASIGPIPVIAVCEGPHNGEAERAAAEGFVALVVRPTEIEKLVELVDQISAGQISAGAASSSSP